MEFSTRVADWQLNSVAKHCPCIHRDYLCIIFSIVASVHVNFTSSYNSYSSVKWSAESLTNLTGGAAPVDTECTYEYRILICN